MSNVLKMSSWWLRTATHGRVESVTAWDPSPFWTSADVVPRKWSKDDDHQHHTSEPTPAAVASSSANRKLASREALDSVQTLNSASSRRSHEAEPRLDEHVPHSICASFMSTKVAQLHKKRQQ